MFQQTLDVFEIPAQVLELLLDAFAPCLGWGAFLLGNGQIRFTRFFPVGARLRFQIRMRIQMIDDLLCQFPRFVQKAQVCRVTNGLWSHRGIQDQLRATEKINYPKSGADYGPRMF